MANYPRLPEQKPPYLTEKMWDVITRRANGETLKAIGESHGCGRESIRQAEARAWRMVDWRRKRGLPDDHVPPPLDSWRAEIDGLFAQRSEPWANTVCNILLRAGCRTRDDIARLSDDELLSLRNFGKRCLVIVREVVPFAGGGAE